MQLALSSAFLLILFALSAFFSASETALFSLTKLERRRLAERHPLLSKWVFYHLERPRRTLISILIGNLLTATLASSLATLIFLDLFNRREVGFALAVFAVIFILLAEITPKILAARKNQAVALLAAFPLQCFAVLIYPFRKLTRLVTDWILSLMIRERVEHADIVSEEELKTLLKIGEEDGILDREERRMIQKLFELGERPVKDILIPRIDVVAVDIDDPPETRAASMRKHHFSHLPVFQKSIDNILGVVSIQEYMLSADRDIKRILKQPLFVPETKQIDDLLAQFRREEKNFAVCVDEYGGTAGIVTLEDILEEIFGEFYDEYAKVENPIRPFGPGEFLVEAKTGLADFNEHFGTHLESESASTLAGFLLEKMGEVPAKGKVLKDGKCEFRIHEAIRQRIRTVVVRVAK